MAVIFADYFLFDRIFGDINDSVMARANSYLIELQLDKKVSISEGRFSTLALSDGQRKRLALLVALLEDKPLYLFDEWAAEQDPHFRTVFYRKILPDLKSRGKAVIVISHDDKYFDVADQILRMENGMLV
jgi:putative ATP-binding cassette transporter